MPQHAGLAPVERQAIGQNHHGCAFFLIDFFDGLGRGGMR
jgi:hypothetical protein